MPAWYVIKNGADRFEFDDAAGQHTSAAEIHALVRAELAAGVACKDVWLGGFSQGVGVIPLGRTPLRMPRSSGGPFI